MKILKHGYMMPRRFTCRFCGCIFVADRREYGTSVDGCNFYVNCPDCNAKLDMCAPLYKEGFELLDEIMPIGQDDADDWSDD